MYIIKGLGKFIFTLFVSFLLFISCQKDDNGADEEQVKLQEYLFEKGYHDIEPTESGLYHIILNEGEGLGPELSDFVRIDFTASLVDGTVFDSSKEDVSRSHGLFDDDRFYGPLKLEIKKIGVPGLIEGLMLMDEGESGRIIIPSNLGFGSIDYGIVPPYSTLIYDVELFDVISDPAEHEQAELDFFLKENDITEPPTESGMYYIEIEEGEGTPITDTSEVTLAISGFLLDGRIFYSTSDSGPIDVNIATSTFIPAFIEGVMKMKTDGEAMIIIPWDLGYGEEGSSDGVIPPYSTIVFNVEVIEIR